jgi:hypothetical protein
MIHPHQIANRQDLLRQTRIDVLRHRSCPRGVLFPFRANKTTIISILTTAKTGINDSILLSYSTITSVITMKIMMMIMMMLIIIPDEILKCHPQLRTFISSDRALMPRYDGASEAGTIQAATGATSRARAAV